MSVQGRGAGDFEIYHRSQVIPPDQMKCNTPETAISPEKSEYGVARLKPGPPIKTSQLPIGESHAD